LIEGDYYLLESGLPRGASRLSRRPGRNLCGESSDDDWIAAGRQRKTVGGGPRISGFGELLMIIRCWEFFSAERFERRGNCPGKHQN